MIASNKHKLSISEECIKRKIDVIRIFVRNETLQHNNARHSTGTARDPIQCLDLSVLLHPQCSHPLPLPDLALVITTTPITEGTRAGPALCCDEEVVSAVKKLIQKQNTDLSKSEFKS